MPRTKVQPNGWVALRLPNDSIKVLQVVPHTTISLGKYGAFPSNLIIERPFHLTYEVQDKVEGETFSRLRVVPAAELNADALADTNTNAEANDDDAAPAVGDDNVITTADGEEMTLVDESGTVVARSNREIIDSTARQTLTPAEIDELKQKGAAAGKELIAKLLLSHTGLDQKTAYSLAKYKLLKTKKYIRRFTVLPLDVPLLGQWLLEDRDASKIMELRHEMVALIGCWADVHFAAPPAEDAEGPFGGRWLVVDDTGGLLVAALAERMGLLYPEPQDDTNGVAQEEGPQLVLTNGQAAQADNSPHANKSSKRRPRRNDLEVHYAPTNTMTLLHSSSQPNLTLLRYFGYDATDPDPTEPYHPLFTNVLPISWLQLIAPEEDASYNDQPAEIDPAELSSLKTNRRGNYHRKRRRWARTRHIVDTARAGGFTGLAVASTMDPVSVVRHALPLLAGGSPLAIYSPTIEPLTQLADCFSVSRRAAWITNPPVEAQGRSAADLENWEGSLEFPLNPTLLLGATLQTSRAKRWQVLEGRTHPFMTGRGGAEGFLFTGWRALPVDGKIEARGRFSSNKRKADAS